MPEIGKYTVKVNLDFSGAKKDFDKFAKDNATIPGLSALGGGGGEVAGPGGAEGIGAAIGTKIPMLGAIAIGIGVAVSTLKLIHGLMGKMTNILEKASPEFAGIRDLQDKMWNLALRPIAHVITTLMQPYIFLAMQYMKPKIQAMQGVIAESGGILTEEAIAEIEAIWKDTATGLAFINQQMMAAIGPIVGTLAGFQTGLDISFNAAISGVVETVTGFLAGLSEGLSVMPEDLANWILDEASKDTSFLRALPTNIADKWLTWLSIKEDVATNLVTYVTDTWKRRLTAGTNILGAVFITRAMTMDQAIASLEASIDRQKDVIDTSVNTWGDMVDDFAERYEEPIIQTIAATTGQTEAEIASHLANWPGAINQYIDMDVTINTTATDESVTDSLNEMVGDITGG